MKPGGRKPGEKEAPPGSGRSLRRAGSSRSRRNRGIYCRRALGVSACGLADRHSPGRLRTALRCPGHSKRGLAWRNPAGLLNDPFGTPPSLGAGAPDRLPPGRRGQMAPSDPPGLALASGAVFGCSGGNRPAPTRQTTEGPRAPAHALVGGAPRGPSDQHPLYPRHPPSKRPEVARTGIHSGRRLRSGLPPIGSSAVTDRRCRPPRCSP